MVGDVDGHSSRAKLWDDVDQGEDSESGLFLGMVGSRDHSIGCSHCIVIKGINLLCSRLEERPECKGLHMGFEHEACINESRI